MKSNYLYFTATLRRNTYFYLICSESELDIEAHGTDPGKPHEPDFTITQMTKEGWETYHANTWKKRQVLPYVEAVYRTLSEQGVFSEEQTN